MRIPSRRATKLARSNSQILDCCYKYLVFQLGQRSAVRHIGCHELLQALQTLLVPTKPLFIRQYSWLY